MWWLWCAAFLIVCITHCAYKWSNPRSNGTLPPGSMGFPILGETFQFLKPSHSLDILPFFKDRILRYGPIFKTSVAGRKFVITTDPNVNQFLLQQEGKLVEMWYLDAYAKFFKHDGSCNDTGHIHKFLRAMILKRFGYETLKDKLLSRVESMVRQRLEQLSLQSSVDLPQSLSKMVFDLVAAELFSYDPETSSDDMTEMFMNFLKGLMCFPIDFPGTAFHNCLKKQKKVLNLLRQTVNERLAHPETRHDDLLDCLVQGSKEESFLTEEFILYTLFGLMFASIESIPTTLTLLIKFVTENPPILNQVTVEQEGICTRKASSSNGLSWEDYKSMNFTLQAVNETLRVANVGVGILRRALQEINVNGYTIPAGWSVLIAPAALHMNPNIFKNPLDFNPSRWNKDDNADGLKISMNSFAPFGGGIRSCPGADLSKMVMAVFLHVMVTEYKCIKVKEGRITRDPTLGFGEKGYHIKLHKKISAPSL